MALLWQCSLSKQYPACKENSWKLWAWSDLSDWDRWEWASQICRSVVISHLSVGELTLFLPFILLHLFLIWHLSGMVGINLLHKSSLMVLFTSQIIRCSHVTHTHTGDTEVWVTAGCGPHASSMNWCLVLCSAAVSPVGHTGWGWVYLGILESGNEGSREQERVGCCVQSTSAAGTERLRRCQLQGQVPGHGVL